MLADGSLDPTFGTGGIVTTTVGPLDAWAADVALDAVGRIVVAGTAWNGSNYDIAVARYNSDGSLDGSFDDDGVVMTTNGTNEDRASSLAIDTDGKIVVAGSTWNGTNWKIALVRYNADGSRDPSFDTDGRVITAIGAGDSYGQGIAIDGSGRIIVSGYAASENDSKFALARYNANGSLDTSFDGDGKLTTHIGTEYDLAGGVVIDVAGKIVVAGTSSQGGRWLGALARYNENGTLDTSFDGDGKVTMRSPETESDGFYGITIDAAGRIVTIGTSNTETSYVGMLARYRANGSLDSDFDGDGMLLLKMDGVRAFCGRLAIDSQGRIIVAGYTGDGQVYDIGVARLNADGTADPGFDGDGKVFTHVYAGFNTAAGVAIDGDDKVVVAGMATNDFIDGDFCVVRYGSAGDAFDYGDAPTAAQSGFASGYPTLAADNGARHVLGSGLYLGASVDAEGDGQPESAASGDDGASARDEDGVELTPLLAAGVSAQATVIVSAAGKLDAWIDFNRDGDWDDAGEQVAASLPLTAGTNAVNIAVPKSVVEGESFARFRLSSAGGLAPSGPANNGEVEDYAVRLALPGKAMLVDDPLSPGAKMLLAVGTKKADKFEIKPTADRSGVIVKFKRSEQVFPADSFGRIAVFSLKGKDKVRIDREITAPAWLDGGADKDVLTGGGGHNVLLGGAGRDVLNGGPLGDLLIGGGDSDKLYGGHGAVPPGDSDLLIGGTTRYDVHDAALQSILALWTSENDYLNRWDILRAGYGVPPLNASTCTADGAADALTGGVDLDLFIAGAEDTVTDQEPIEQIATPAAPNSAAGAQSLPGLPETAALPQPYLVTRQTLRGKSRKN